MRRFLLCSTAALTLAAGAAAAADLPPRMPVKAAPVLLYDWSGLYAGAYVGVGINRSHAFDPRGVQTGEIEYTGTGFTGGGTLGYNWKFGNNWVAGIEGDLGYLGLDRDINDWNETTTTVDLIFNSKTSWIGTLRGRIGYSNGPTLSYITGGGAWVRFEDSAASLPLPATTSSKTKGGYALGSGVETMLGGRWTAKAEYLFVDVGSGDLLRTAGYGLQTDEHRYHLMKYGVNYLFGGKPQPPLQPYNWGGFYVGIVGGTALTQARATDTLGVTVGEIGNNGTGLTVGGLVGYNWQYVPSWIAGVEGDFSWLGVDHSSNNFNDSPAILTVKTNWLATVRGRLGYSTGPALLYATAGGAWLSVRDNWNIVGAGTPDSSASKTLSGYTVGGGIEVTFAGNWTTRTEYLYVDAGNVNVPPSDGEPLTVDHRFHIFRGALTYKFGAPKAVVAKY